MVSQSGTQPPFAPPALPRYNSGIERDLVNKGARPVLVGVAGGSGSGKTWLADRLAKAFAGISTRVALDDFYQDRSHLAAPVRGRCNFDRPGAIDWAAFDEALERLTANQAARIPAYDFATHCRKPIWQTLAPRPLVIIDGLWVLRRPAVRRLLDLKIFVECPAATRLERRLQRDMASRGRTKSSIRRQFRDTVDPMHRKYVSPQERFADIVLGEDKPPQVIRALIRRIRALMARAPGVPGKKQTFHF